MIYVYVFKMISMNKKYINSNEILLFLISAIFNVKKDNDKQCIN